MICFFYISCMWRLVQKFFYFLEPEHHLQLDVARSSLGYHYCYMNISTIGFAVHIVYTVFVVTIINHRTPGWKDSRQDPAGCTCISMWRRKDSVTNNC
jgi:cytochrome b subunit of formate dehydrogenase